MAILGAEGLERVAAACHANTARLAQQLCEVPGVEPIFDAPVFHERALRLPAPTETVLAGLAEQDILGGFDLGREYPELGSALLVCATEKRTDAEIAAYREALTSALVVAKAA
ncbi:MAG: glycine dehydrogenase, partial [Chromatiaceae bacterium]|nr:glycine dehydrogenase [Chromatiaceae bacterium]